MRWGRVLVVVVMVVVDGWQRVGGGDAIQQGRGWKMSSEEVSRVICSSLTIRLVWRWTPPPPHLHLSLANCNLVLRESHVGENVGRNWDSKTGLFPRCLENMYWYVLHVCSEDWHGIKRWRVGAWQNINAREVQGNALGKRDFSTFCCIRQTWNWLKLWR